MSLQLSLSTLLCDYKNFIISIGNRLPKIIIIKNNNNKKIIKKKKKKKTALAYLFHYQE